MDDPRKQGPRKDRSIGRNSSNRLNNQALVPISIRSSRASHILRSARSSSQRWCSCSSWRSPIGGSIRPSISKASICGASSSLFWRLVTFVLFVFRQIYQTGMGKREKSPKKVKLFSGLMAIPIAIAVIGAVGWLASQSFFPGNAEKYSTVLVTEDADFATDIPEVNYSEIPFIDKDSAILLGNRTMGTMADYVSQFEISDLYSQINYKGQPVRVSPLNYADFFKWWANKDGGIPAYVIVNMSTQDTEIVRLENPIRYSDSDPFFYNVDRHVQLSYPFYMFDEKSFEINDDGEPFWIYPVQKRTIGLFGGTTIQRVVLCNASTGECQDFAIEDVPQWVDRAYPAELLIEQYNWERCTFRRLDQFVARPEWREADYALDRW